jgi:hypothetical protein
MDSLETPITDDSLTADPGTPDNGPGPDPQTISDEPTFTVKVRGEEQVVPLSELVNGYSRTADYTLKTQELAQQRQEAEQGIRILQAFQRDPESTLRALQDAYGFGAEPDEVEEIDPDEARLRQFEAFMQEQRERELNAHIDAEFARLERTYGEYDQAELAAFMLQNNIQSFDAAFKAWRFDSVYGRAQSDQQATEAKQSLPPVAGGRGVQAGAVAPGRPDHGGGVRGAWARAKEELNL